MAWVCTNGHGNSDDMSAVCTVCGAGKGGGIDPRALAYTLIGIFAGPGYPVAGGLSWAAAIAGFFGLGVLGVPQGARFLIMALTALVLFYVLLKYEAVAARSSLYRLIRDIVRIGVGIFLLIGVISNNHFPPIENIGIVLLFPLAFFLVKRLDQVLEVGKPEEQNGRLSMPDWLTDFIDASNWRAAQFAGLGAAMLGFALGRDARVVSALVMYALAMLAVMLFSGGMSALRNSGPIVKGLLGAIGGGILGILLFHNDLGMISSAIGAAAIVPLLWK